MSEGKLPQFTACFSPKERANEPWNSVEKIGGLYSAANNPQIGPQMIPNRFLTP